MDCKRLILNDWNFKIDYNVVEKEVKHLNHVLKGASPFTDFSMSFEGIIESVNSDNYTVSELLREIANRIEQKTEYEIKPWIDAKSE